MTTNPARQVRVGPTPFAHWIRTGRWLPEQIADPALEVKFNPNHDPKDGRFTFKNGGGSAASKRTAKKSSPQKRDGRWGSGEFSGGGGGSFGGGGATGYYMTHDEVQAYQRQHPGRDPYIVQLGDTLTNVAAAHGLTVEQVSSLNGIAPGAAIMPGQTLALPGGSLQQVERNGYAFGIDPVDRTHEAKGELHLAITQQRSKTNQLQAGGIDRRATDDGGHFIAARFDGPTDSFNHFAQDANFNRGGYRAIEDGWAEDLRAGKHVSVDIVAHYPGESRRPDSLRVSWSDGTRSQVRTFQNEPKGKPRGQ